MTARARAASGAFEVPNVTALPITAGNADFVAWVKTETLAGSPAA